MAHTGQRDPWEKLPGETARQYECFCAYRDMRYLEKPKKPGDVVRPDLPSAAVFAAWLNSWELPARAWSP